MTLLSEEEFEAARNLALRGVNRQRMAASSWEGARLRLVEGLSKEEAFKRSGAKSNFAVPLAVAAVEKAHAHIQLIKSGRLTAIWENM